MTHETKFGDQNVGGVFSEKDSLFPKHLLHFLFLLEPKLSSVIFAELQVLW